MEVDSGKCKPCRDALREAERAGQAVSVKFACLPTATAFGSPTVGMKGVFTSRDKGIVDVYTTAKDLDELKDHAGRQSQSGRRRCDEGRR